MSIDDMRNVLIVEMGAMTGMGKELQGLSNIELVALGLGKLDPGISLHQNTFVRGVLLAGKFRAQHELNRMSEEDQRNTLIVELSGRSNQHNLQGFNSFDLAGMGAVLVFLRTAGIRDDAGLKTMSFDDMRNTLIVEIDGQTHLGLRLQGLSNLDLVLAGLGVDKRAQLAALQIEEKYRQIGGKQSLLGRPVDSLSVQSNGQGFFRDFRGGQIKVTSDGTASAFVTHRTVVRFRGIHAFGVSEVTDEPYAIVGVYASDARDKIVVKKFPVGRDSYTDFKPGTDASESEEIFLDVAPQTLVIVSTVMEHDSGDPDRVAAQVEDSLKKAAIDAGADPAEVSVFTGILDDLGIPGLIADVLGVGDDLIGIQALQLDINEIIPKRPMNQFGNISSNFESPLLSDGDASYKLFYEVFVEEVLPVRVL
jgi:hypothetical protein